jgi:hypothetical protein
MLYRLYGRSHMERETLLNFRAYCLVAWWQSNSGSYTVYGTHAHVMGLTALGRKVVGGGVVHRLARYHRGQLQ